MSCDDPSDAYIVLKLLPMTVTGSAMTSKPHIWHSDARSIPHTPRGYMSPYPVVAIVTTAHQTA